MYFLHLFITEETIVYSDKWAAFLSFFASGVNYHHETVNHSEIFVKILLNQMFINKLLKGCGHI